MRKRNVKERETIAMLLDPAHYFGESRGRMGPTLLFLCAAGAPILIFLYYGLYRLVPMYISVPIGVIWVIYAGLLTLGQQRKRVAIYKKQLNDVYALTNDLLRIKMVHENGIIEMLNGRCKYIIVCTNPTVDDDVEHTFDVRDFQLSLLANIKDFDIDVYNDVEATLLDNRYSRVNKFHDKDAAEAYVSVIDYQREITKEHSTKCMIVYTLTFPKYEWKHVTEQIQNVLSSKLVRAWKTVTVVNDINAVNKILSRDIYGYVDIDEMVRKKYCTNNFLGAKVLGYDDFDAVKEEDEDVEHTEASSFIPVYQEKEGVKL